MTANFLCMADALRCCCKANNQYGVYISIVYPPGADFDDIIRDAPFMQLDEAHLELLMSGAGFLLFESEKEMLEYFEKTKDPALLTEQGGYNSGVRVFALSCGPDGLLQDENT